MTHQPAPTALMLLRLVKVYNQAHVPLDLIWQAVLGVTDQHQRQRISEEAYDMHCRSLRAELVDHLALTAERGKYVVGEGDMEVVVPGAQTGHIEEGPEFRFFLYRHWPLFDAMCFSPYVAAKLHVWQSVGTGRLRELLAKLGVPLQQCKQTFTFMSPAVRDHFRRQIVSPMAREDYNLKGPDVSCRSFFRYNSFRNPVAACDVVHAASALLEQCRSRIDDMSSNSLQHVTSSRLEAFNEAYDCLGMRNEDAFKQGVEAALGLQKVTVLSR